ncbi:AsmA family protein [Chromobacterium haemolyticum]|uniref:AsmA family protein n=1 Tax=Chromobacterium haemolyticum TaxID=394935 RepID=UPI0005B82284|nr:AsmA family protein [Chromobacterium haemolyticum]MDH0341748.1 AsmA family protein [Chromobacterium haemolyticum]QOD83739.1 AsmA family protein [Chromobacterium haemolyticum]
MKLNSGRLWLRITVYSLTALVAVVVLVQSLIYWQFDEAQVRGTLSHALQDTGRVISIEGRVTPVLFPAPGIQIEKLSVSEPGLQTPFARVEELRVGLAWWPLLFGNREVSSVALYGPSANISRGEDGRLSIADLFQRHSQSSFSIKLDTLKIREGTLVLSDQMTHTDSRVASISLDAEDLRGGASLSAGAILEQGSRPVRLAVNTPLSIQDDQVSLEALDAVAMTQVPGLGESKLTVSGQYKLNFATLQATGSNVALAFSSERPSSEVHLALPQINASFDELTMPSGQLSAKLSYARSQYQLEAALENLKLNEAGLYADKLHGDFNWQAGSTKVNVKLNAPLSLAGMNQLRMQPLALTSTITTPLLPRGKLVSTMDGALDGDLDEPRFNLRVAGKMDGSDLAVTVSQYGLIKPRHEATVSVGRLDLNRYLPESKGDPVAIFQNTGDIPLDWLDLFDLTGKVAIGELAVGRFRIKQISSNVRINPRELELDQMSADIYEGRLQGDASLSRRDVPQLKVNQTLQGMKIRPLLVDLFNFSRLDGKGNGKIDINADGKSFAQLRNTLSGNVQMSLNNGALTGIDLVAALKNLPAELKEWNSAAQNDQKTTFSTLSSSFRLDKGVARSQDLKLASQLMNVGGGGKIDLKQSIVDYTMDVQANPLAFARLKGVNVPLKITGPLNAPVYALDFNAMVKGKKTEVEKQQALKQQLQKQITTILP